MIPLLLKACLFHDSGREGEGVDLAEWERESSKNFAEHLRNCGLSQSLAWQCGEAIRLKDDPEACQSLLEHVQTLRSLLHDADALDVMRVRRRFYMDRLECFSRCHNDSNQESVRALAKTVCETIARQGDLNSAITLQDTEDPSTQFFSRDYSLSIEEKQRWEHHFHPLCHQLLEIPRHSEFIENLIGQYSEAAGNPKPHFSLQKLNKKTGPKGGASIGESGQYTDPATGQSYYIKETVSKESACNQVLMANLARQLGLQVPETFIHQEQETFFVVSHWQNNLQGGKEALKALSEEQWAKLFLINVIIGNEDMVNHGWKNIELTPEGEPVMFDWDWAGLATRYKKEEQAESPDPNADDYSSMPVLLKMLRTPGAPAMNSRHTGSQMACRPILEKLTDEQLGRALTDILQNVHWQNVRQLIEHSGFRAGDRTWLTQTLYDRMAWLALRLPGTRNDQPISTAEYKAIEASGIRGGWLQVNSPDIPAGQVCVTQLLDDKYQPLTRLTLKLSREASNRLADNLAIEHHLHRLQAQIKYFNDQPKSNYLDWRSDQLKLAAECLVLAEQLEHDKSRWQDQDQPTIENIAGQLKSIASQCQASATAEQPSEQENLPVIPEKLPVPRFPARVTSRPGEDNEAKVQLAEYSHGFARLTGETVSYLEPSPVRAIQLSPRCTKPAP